MQVLTAVACLSPPSGVKKRHTGYTGLLSHPSGTR